MDVCILSTQLIDQKKCESCEVSMLRNVEGNRILRGITESVDPIRAMIYRMYFYLASPDIYTRIQDKYMLIIGNRPPFPP